jgi:hypothetical protein
VGLQRFSAIQGAGASRFSEFFDHGGRDSHVSFLLVQYDRIA